MVTIKRLFYNLPWLTTSTNKNMRCIMDILILKTAISWSGAPEPQGQRGQLAPLPKQCGGSTGAAGCLFYQNCTSNVVRFSHELKLKTVFKEFSSYLKFLSETLPISFHL
jgi:hypothetical protein